MTWNQARSAAVELLMQLPPIPKPWNITELCGQLTKRRGRVLLLQPLVLPALPFGLWHDDGVRDHIIYRGEASGYYRDHIILHEICHMLAGHNRLDTHLPGMADPREIDYPKRLVEHAIRNGHTSFQEEMAEIFASQVLRLAKETRSELTSSFERRAAAIFGADNV